MKASSGSGLWPTRISRFSVACFSVTVSIDFRFCVKLELRAVNHAVGQQP